MKVVFVNTRTDIYPPLGLCYLSAYLKKHQVSVIVALVEIPAGNSAEAAAKKILSHAPDVVGLTTYTVGFTEIVELCTLLKSKSPKTLIVLGGPHITSLPDSLPSSADIGVLGEGEMTFLQICQTLEVGGLACPSIRTIPGICFHSNDGIAVTAGRDFTKPLDLIPPPDLSILNMKWYTAYRTYLIMKGNYRGFVLLTSRGCPFQCRFCQASAQWGGCRYHSAERVVEELSRLRKEFPRVNAINIIDDLFIGDRKRLGKIVGLIKKQGLHHGVVFNVNGHVNMVNEEVLSLLKSINVVQIAYGFESGSERILKFLKKGAATVAQNRRAAELTDSFGIGVGGQFMIGNPGESERDIRETINFIKKTKMSHVHISTTTPMPGTELFDICREKGLVSDDMDWRKLDFGNPDNPNLLYCNEETLPKRKFNTLRDEVQKSADRWNPVPSFLANFSYWQLYDSGEFMRRVLQGLMRLRKQYANKMLNWFN